MNGVVIKPELDSLGSVFKFKDCCVTNMACSGTRERDLTRKYNLKPLRVNITRISKKQLDFYQINLEKSSEQILKFEEIKLEPSQSFYYAQNSETAENKLEERESCSETSVKCLIKRVTSDILQHDAAMDHLQDDLGNARTSELIIKSEECSSKGKDLEDTDDSCIARSSLYRNLKTESVSPSQAEDGLQDELTSELIIKSEPECSERDETQENADSEGGNLRQDISKDVEKKTSPQDCREQSKKVRPHCPFATRSKPTLSDHMQAHGKSERTIIRQAGSSSYACHICNRVFQYKQSRDRHVTMHERNEMNEKGFFKCEVCNKEFKRRYELSCHKNVHLKVKPHECLHCKMRFSCQLNLNKHLRRIHKVELLSCSQCKKSFVLKQDLANHLKVHSNVRVLLKCDVCSKCFKNKYALTQHNAVHTDARPFVCEVCAKTFKFKKNLRIHMAAHYVKPDFKCVKCDETFKSKDLLLCHVQSHGTENPIFLCSICSKTFKCKSHLTQHMSFVHSDERPFSCEKCEKSFKTKPNLKQHGAVHSTSYNFKCDLCTSKFKIKQNLFGHVKSVHTKASAVTCPECGKYFKSKQILKSHMTIHYSSGQFVIE